MTFSLDLYRTFLIHGHTIDYPRRTGDQGKYDDESDPKYTYN